MKYFTLIILIYTSLALGTDEYEEENLWDKITADQESTNQNQSSAATQNLTVADSSDPAKDVPQSPETTPQRTFAAIWEAIIGPQPGSSDNPIDLTDLDKTPSSSIIREFHPRGEPADQPPKKTQALLPGDEGMDIWELSQYLSQQMHTANQSLQFIEGNQKHEIQALTFIFALNYCCKTTNLGDALLKYFYFFYSHEKIDNPSIFWGQTPSHTIVEAYPQAFAAALELNINDISRGKKTPATILSHLFKQFIEQLANNKNLYINASNYELFKKNYENKNLSPEDRYEVLENTRFHLTLPSRHLSAKKNARCKPPKDEANRNYPPGPGNSRNTDPYNDHMQSFMSTITFGQSAQKNSASSNTQTQNNQNRHSDQPIKITSNRNTFFEFYIHSLRQERTQQDEGNIYFSNTLDQITTDELNAIIDFDKQNSNAEGLIHNLLIGKALLQRFHNFILSSLFLVLQQRNQVYRNPGCQAMLPAF